MSSDLQKHLIGILSVVHREIFTLLDPVWQLFRIQCTNGRSLRPALSARMYVCLLQQSFFGSAGTKRRSGANIDISREVT